MSSEEEDSDEESDGEDIVFMSPSGMRRKFEKGEDFLDTQWGRDVHLIPQDKSTINNIVMGAEISPLEPKNIQEALQSENREHWKEAIDEEMRQHELNGTFSPPKILPLGFRATKTRFLFKAKLNTQTQQVERWRARLLYQNNAYTGDKASWEETFAPVVDKNTLRIFLHLAASEHMFLKHTDVVSAFIQADMEGEVYVILPEICGDPPGMVRQLFRALNGVKRASQLWHKRLHEFMLNEKFSPNPRDPCVYASNDKKIYCAVYVDDILSAGKEEKQQLSFLKRMGKVFNVRHLGEPKSFLGMELSYFQEAGICTLSQQTYIHKLAGKFLSSTEREYFPTVPVEANVQQKLLQAETEPPFQGPYRELVGGLLYTTVCTRADMSFCLCILTQQFSNPKATHFQLALRALKYLLGTANFGITLGGSKENAILIAFTDSDFAACLKSRKSVGGYVIFFGNSPIMWSAKKHYRRYLCVNLNWFSRLLQSKKSFGHSH